MGAEAKALLDGLKTAMTSLNLEVELFNLLVSPPTKTFIVKTADSPPEPKKPSYLWLYVLVASLTFACGIGAGLGFWKREPIKEKLRAWKEKRKQKKYGGMAEDIQVVEEEGEEEGEGEEGEGRLAIGDDLQESARQRDRPVHGAHRVSKHEAGGEYHDTSGKSRGKDDR